MASIRSTQEQIEFTEHPTYSDWVGDHRQHALNAGDVVMSLRTGTEARMLQDEDLSDGPSFATTDCAVLRCDETLKPEYLWMWLKRDRTKAILAAEMKGARTARLPIQALQNLAISILTESVQRQLGEFAMEAEGEHRTARQHADQMHQYRNLQLEAALRELL